MKRLSSLLLLAVLCQFLAATLVAQPIPSKYLTYDEMTRAIKDLSAAHKDIVTIESIGKTLKGREIWAIALRKGDPNQNRAMLVVGGVEAQQLAGSEMVLRFAEHIANNYEKTDSLRRLLETTTIYLLPRVSPDAMEAYFEKPQRERTTNYRPTDDDRDGLVDEDDAEDLNKDGFITMMRVKDPRGEWMPHPDDARIMKKADAAKGEHGSYLLYTEGIDNDNDERWNEDAAGGVDFNRNFAYNYEYFVQNAGVYQMSEKESRAVADFIFSRPNIAVVFSFSSNDNLTAPWKIQAQQRSAADDEGRSFGQPPGPSPENDQPYFDYINKQFQDITKLKSAPEPKKGMGAFSEWAYYHTGRWSFSVRPWWAPETKAKRDTASADNSRRAVRPTRAPQRDTPELPQDDNTELLRALSWYDANGYKDIFLPWTKTKHPDFPDRDVEIGGPRPYVLFNPPAESINAYAQPFNKFLIYLAAQLPSISLGNVKIERVGDNVFRLTLDIVNSGYFPTNSALGVRVRWPRNVYLTLGLSKDQSLASGRAKQRLSPIKGNGGYETASWLITARAGSTVSVSAESPMAGSATQTITLR